MRVGIDFGEIMYTMAAGLSLLDINLIGMVHVASSLGLTVLFCSFLDTSSYFKIGQGMNQPNISSELQN